jgi:glutaredoxin
VTPARGGFPGVTAKQGDSTASPLAKHRELPGFRRGSNLAFVADVNKVTLYTLSTCPYCEKAKGYFAEHGIPFAFTDYDLADAATQTKIQSELESAGAAGFPFARIGKEPVEGYAPQRYAELLGI